MHKVNHWFELRTFWGETTQHRYIRTQWLGLSIFYPTMCCNFGVIVVIWVRFELEVNHPVIDCIHNYICQTHEASMMYLKSPVGLQLISFPPDNGHGYSAYLTCECQISTFLSGQCRGVDFDLRNTCKLQHTFLFKGIGHPQNIGLIYLPRHSKPFLFKEMYYWFRVHTWKSMGTSVVCLPMFFKIPLCKRKKVTQLQNDTRVSHFV